MGNVRRFLGAADAMFDSDTGAIVLKFAEDDPQMLALVMAAGMGSDSVPIPLAVTGAAQVLVAAPGAGKQIWVCRMFGTITVAGTVKLSDSTPEDLTGPMSYDPNAGLVLSGDNPMSPWLKCATNKALTMTVSAGTFNGSLSYVIMTV